MTLSRPVIFDCDGVLVDSEIIYLETDRECLANIGLHYSDTEYRDRFIGLPDVDFFRQIEKDFETRGLGKFPQGYSDVMKSKASNRILTDLRPICGVVEFLMALTGKVAVASSSEIAALNTKLEITNLLRHFGNHIYSADQVQRGKPEPDLFLFAAKKLDEKPENCIVIEDSLNGVKAASAAGMEVWGFTGGEHANDELPSRLHEAGAHQVFPNFNELLAFVNS